MTRDTDISLALDSYHPRSLHLYLARHGPVMLEDDIQYLGTRSVQRTSLPGGPRPFTDAPRPVTSKRTFTRPVLSLLSVAKHIGH
jgi:hypothetical protein